jgi:hypothetical protein
MESKISKFFTKARSILAKDIRLFNADSSARVNNMPFLPSWFWTAKLGMPRNIDYYELRQYAKAPWVQMVKAAIKKQIMTIEWDIVNSDEEDEQVYEEDMLKAKTLLDQPNRNGQSFGELWGMFMDDVLDIDAGVIFKGRNGSGELVELYAHDGSKFLFDVEEHGIIKGITNTLTSSQIINHVSLIRKILFMVRLDIILTTILMVGVRYNLSNNNLS